jgi:hypothetical protein
MTVPTSQFECVKVSMKQDSSGYVLTLRIHPDEVPEEILRDFVGARYQIVAVRLNDDDTAYPRNQPKTPVMLAGILCRKPRFWDWLESLGEIRKKDEAEAVNALHRIIGITSRSELRNPAAASKFETVFKEFEQWDNEEQPPF